MTTYGDTNAIDDLLFSVEIDIVDFGCISYCNIFVVAGANFQITAYAFKLFRAHEILYMLLYYSNISVSAIFKFR